MRNTKILKTLLSTTLAAAVTVSGIPATSVIAQTKTQTEMVMNDSQWKEIQKDALLDGEKTAEEINEYSGEKFDAAVNAALSSYYKEEKFKELKDFEANINDAAKEIVEDYKDAAEERADGTINGYVPGEVIISFEKGVTKEQIKELVKQEYGVCKDIIEMPNGDFFASVEISLGQTVSQATEIYEKSSLAKIVSADNIATVTEESATFAVNDTKANQQYYLDKINAKGAWDYLQTVSHDNVKVAVIDTGLRTGHEDIQGVVDADSYDVVEDTRLVFSQTPFWDGHGTAVAGIIGAKANNGKGIAGVASAYNNDVVKILAIKAAQLNQYKAIAFADISLIQALAYAGQKHAKVINMSLGNEIGLSAQVEEAINDVTESGSIIVAAAGNSTSSGPAYPSDYDNVISVAATDQNDELASFSNYGLKKDVCAPGTGIWSTFTANNSDYYDPDGTSFAAPMVSAIVAEMCAVNPDLTVDDVRQILIDTSRPVQNVPAGKTPAKGGIVDAEEAVRAAAQFNVPQPLEVIGMVASSPADNTIGVVWGQDGERISSGCTYNVYVNGVKKLSNVGCNYYSIPDVTAGNVTVKVTAVLGNAESTGVTQVVTVNGQTITPETTEEITTVSNELYNVAQGKEVTLVNGTNTDLENIVDGDLNTSWYTGSSVAPEITIDFGAVKDLETMTIYWPNSSRFGKGRTITISEDGNNWTTIESTYQYTPSSTTSVNINATARYVKIKITGTGANYIIVPEIAEVEVFGRDIAGTQEPTTEEPTTEELSTEELTTVAPETTTEPITGPQPLEVIGAVANATADNTIGVVWGQDGERIASGCMYNVYVNDVLRLSAVGCNYYVISDVAAGNAKVTIKSTLNGVESNGVTLYVNVSGQQVEQTTAAPTTAAPTTAAPTTAVPTTAAPETTTAQVNGPQPLEVIGQVASALGNNSIGVVWGQDGERIASGCQYNVYVDGELKLAQVNCGYYVISGLSAGTKTVVFKSVLNGIESNGVTATVNVY